MGTKRKWHWGLHMPRMHSRTEQVLLWDDTNQSSKQMLSLSWSQRKRWLEMELGDRVKSSNALSGW